MGDVVCDVVVRAGGFAGGFAGHFAGSFAGGFARRFAGDFAGRYAGSFAARYAGGFAGAVGDKFGGRGRGDFFPWRCLGGIALLCSGACHDSSVSPSGPRNGEGVLVTWQGCACDLARVLFAGIV